MGACAFQMKIMSRYARVFKNEYLQQLGLVHREAEMILSLARDPGRSQDDIAEALLIDKSSVARCLSNLEERGLVVRTVSPTDRRVTLVELSPEAVALVPKIREINVKWREFMMEELSEEERQIFSDAIEKIYQKVRVCAAERRKKP